jgi:DNA/RNA endonuclease YhcR with UshA esterase domain
VGYETPDLLQSVFAADLDGDGDCDLAATGSHVSVFLNNGDGTFQTAVSYFVNIYAYSVFAADLDGDGYRDLAVANSFYAGGSGNVAVLINDGDGTFLAAVSYETPYPPSSVVAADLDGDGDPDLAASGGYVSVFFNDGDGTFEAAVDYGVGTSIGKGVTADLDGDGDQDLALANSGSNSVSVLINNGDGTFQVPVGYEAGDHPLTVSAADVDGDGDRDLAVAGRDKVFILMNVTDD